MPAETPMMRQYKEIKERNGDSILFFRLGDFYEMFGDDARTASKELDLVLTTRDRATENPEERIPMCGVPYHSSEGYIARLIAKGYKVAICEQTQDPALAKGLVERDIVRVVTPGTLIESSMLDEERPNYLCSVYMGDSTAACFADLSTGEISVTEFAGGDIGHIENELSSFAPAEAIINDAAARNGRLTVFLSERLSCLTQCCDERFDEAAAGNAVRTHFGDSAPQLGAAAVCAVGGLLSYLADTQKTDISHINTLRVNTGSAYMELDIQTLRSLELVASLRTGEKKGSLLGVLDKTKTPMGRRMLRAWVLRPLLSSSAIIRRLNAVAELVGETVIRRELALCLRRISDIERLIGKIVYGSAGGRDMRALAASIGKLPELTRLLHPMKSAALCDCAGMDTLSDIAALIDCTIVDEPPFSVREGGFIRPGADTEADRLRDLLENSSAALAAIEERERERVSRKLKVGYNKVFGYYLELPRSVSDDVPDDYLRKQTLANCERFTTQELKALETELLTARDRLCDLEYRLFTQLRESVAAHVARVQSAAAGVAMLDALCSLAETAAANNYCMPEIDISGVIDIRDGRHPVVESMMQDTPFVPNDTYLDCGAARTAIITGPNMAGKSTYMRQTALIVIMAQIGSFVPARSARIGIVDRVFTRIGASDDLSAGKSTFMVEMTEVADILHNATSKSLIILDEVGRGTSTYDGMAVARAVLEHCTDKRKIGAKTMFATHYHELTQLEDEIDGVKNYNITAKKRGDDIIFLRKIVPGGADDSYGIEVAGIAQIPESVIKRAHAVLKMLEDGSAPAPAPRAAKVREDSQISLLDMGAADVAEALRMSDLNTLTPLEALNLLFELKKKL